MFFTIDRILTKVNMEIFSSLGLTAKFSGVFAAIAIATDTIAAQNATIPLVMATTAGVTLFGAGIIYGGAVAGIKASIKGLEEKAQFRLQAIQELQRDVIGLKAQFSALSTSLQDLPCNRGHCAAKKTDQK